MALKFEKSCVKAGLDVRIVPVPRTLSSSCGFACRYPCDAHDRVVGLAEERNIEVAEYHKVDDL
jgi:hypothetical protein